MIDSTGTVKIIDFGSTRRSGVVENAAPDEHVHMLEQRNTLHRNIFWGRRAPHARTFFHWA
jgi:hypothetical protein